MKVKLFKVHGEREYDEDGYGDVLKACIDTQSDWEEVSYEEYNLLTRWARESRNIKQGYSFAVVVEPELPIKECIAEQMKRENDRIERQRKIEEERKKAYKKREETRKLNRLEKLKKELSILENEK